MQRKQPQRVVICCAFKLHSPHAMQDTITVLQLHYQTVTLQCAQLTHPQNWYCDGSSKVRVGVLIQLVQMLSILSRSVHGASSVFVPAWSKC